MQNKVPLISELLGNWAVIKIRASFHIGEDQEPFDRWYFFLLSFIFQSMGDSFHIPYKYYSFKFASIKKESLKTQFGIIVIKMDLKFVLFSSMFFVFLCFVSKESRQYFFPWKVFSIKFGWKRNHPCINIESTVKYYYISVAHLLFLFPTLRAKYEPLAIIIWCL